MRNRTNKTTAIHPRLREPLWFEALGPSEPIRVGELSISFADRPPPLPIAPAATALVAAATLGYGASGLLGGNASVSHAAPVERLLASFQPEKPALPIRPASKKHVSKPVELVAEPRRSRPVSHVGQRVSTPLSIGGTHRQPSRSGMHASIASPRSHPIRVTGEKSATAGVAFARANALNKPTASRKPHPLAPIVEPAAVAAVGDAVLTGVASTDTFGRRSRWRSLGWWASHRPVSPADSVPASTTPVLPETTSPPTADPGPSDPSGQDQSTDATAGPSPTTDPAPDPTPQVTSTVTVPIAAASVETVPADTVPADTVPADTVPSVAAPVVPAPAQAAPADTTPTDPTPADPAPVDAIPAAAAPAITPAAPVLQDPVPQDPAPPSASGFWSAVSLLNTPLSSFVVDPNSANWLARLSGTESYGLWVDYQQWTPPVYHANASTPRVTVSLPTFHTQITIPYQSSFQPDPTEDSQIAVIDDSTGCEYEFEAFNPSSLSANSEGTYNVETGTGLHANDAGVTGGNISMLGGLITPQDIASGSIDHALRAASPINAPTFVAPGSDSDGSTPGGIPEGQLMRLDPSLDLSQFNLDPFQLMVARALQQYGAYVADTSTSFKVYAENTIDGSSYASSPSPLPWSVVSHLQFGSTSYSDGELATNSNSFSGCDQQH